jgi:hypothetical protein
VLLQALRSLAELDEMAGEIACWQTLRCRLRRWTHRAPLLTMNGVLIEHFAG